MNTTNRFQFTTSTILGATSFVALLLVLLPFACQVYVEIVCLPALFLCLVASIADQATQLRINYLRRLLSVLFAIAAIALIVHVLRGKVSWFPSAPIALTIFISFLRPAMMKFGNYRIAWSSMGCVILSAIMALQFYQTSSQSYFVNRNLTHGYESETFERDGVVSYTLHSQMHNLRRRGPFEIETLFDALDVDSCYRPVTKCRMLSGSDKINSLSFEYATSPLDWTKLSSQSQLEFIDFNALRISSAEIKSLDSMTKLHQLAFFACELPANFLGSCRNAKKLSILQIVDCKVPDLVGISALQGLRKLNLHKTKLSQSDLNEVSMLSILTDLDLRETELTTEDFVSFAMQLKANPFQRLGRFRCVVTYDPKITKGLATLINSGAINELVLANFESSDEDLKFLRSVDTKVAITPVPIEESGIK